jgi:hypothetical protein
VSFMVETHGRVSVHDNACGGVHIPAQGESRNGMADLYDGIKILRMCNNE